MMGSEDTLNMDTKDDLSCAVLCWCCVSLVLVLSCLPLVCLVLSRLALPCLVLSCIPLSPREELTDERRMEVREYQTLTLTHTSLTLNIIT